MYLHEEFVTLLCPACFQDFRTKTTESHMALHERNSGTKSGRELFKGSKDAPCLLFCTRKKLIWLG